MIVSIIAIIIIWLKRFGAQTNRAHVASSVSFSTLNGVKQTGMALPEQTGPQYCEYCVMWLNGQTAMNNHKKGRKHKRKDTKNGTFARKGEDEEAPRARERHGGGCT